MVRSALQILNMSIAILILLQVLSLNKETGKAIVGMTGTRRAFTTEFKLQVENDILKQAALIMEQK